MGGIPEEWRKKCFLSSLLLLFADELYRMSLTIREAPPMSVMESTYLRGVQRYAGEGEVKGIIRAIFSNNIYSVTNIFSNRYIFIFSNRCIFSNRYI